MRQRPRKRGVALRGLLAGLLFLVELPFLLPFIAVALITGLIAGAGELAKRLNARRAQ
jgi:hypothetical protein